jgi:hypothetical protein
MTTFSLESSARRADHADYPGKSAHLWGNSSASAAARVWCGWTRTHPRSCASVKVGAVNRPTTLTSSSDRVAKLR